MSLGALAKRDESLIIFKVGKSISLLLLLIIIAGCASSRGFNRESIETTVMPGSNLPSSAITDDHIDEILKLNPQLRFPFKLGVYFMEKQSYRSWGYNTGWDADDRNLDWLNPLKEAGIVSEIIPITSASITDRTTPSLRSLRLAAARHNADAILIIGYGSDVDRYNNFSAFLYLTIVGAYLVPGTHANALVIMNAGLWDVRNEYLYMTLEVEAEARKIGPAFLLKNEKAVKKAKEKAFPLFQKQVIQRIRAMAGK